VLAGIEKS